MSISARSMARNSSSSRRGRYRIATERLGFGRGVLLSGLSTRSGGGLQRGVFGRRRKDGLASGSGGVMWRRLKRLGEFLRRVAESLAVPGSGVEFRDCFRDCFRDSHSFRDSRIIAFGTPIFSGQPNRVSAFRGSHSFRDSQPSSGSGRSPHGGSATASCPSRLTGVPGYLGVPNAWASSNVWVSSMHPSSPGKSAADPCLNRLMGVLKCFWMFGCPRMLGCPESVPGVRNPFLEQPQPESFGRLQCGSRKPHRRYSRCPRSHR